MTITTYGSNNTVRFVGTRTHDMTSCSPAGYLHFQGGICAGQGFTNPPHTLGTTYAYTGGGVPTSCCQIERFPYTSESTVSTIGNTTQNFNKGGSASSSENGYFIGGTSNATAACMEKFAFSASANASTVGNLGVPNMQTGNAGVTDGYSSGGDTSNASTAIQKFPYSSDSPASTIGQLTQAIYAGAGSNSATHGYVSGGGRAPSGYTSRINKFPFSTDTNATAVGDLSIGTPTGPSAGPPYGGSGTQSASCGYFTSTAGGAPSGPTGYVDVWPFASDTNASVHGALSLGNPGYYGGSTGSSTAENGYILGNFGPGVVKFPFSSPFSATNGVATLTSSSSGKFGFWN